MNYDDVIWKRILYNASFLRDIPQKHNNIYLSIHLFSQIVPFIVFFINACPAISAGFLFQLCWTQLITAYWIMVVLNDGDLPVERNKIGTAEPGCNDHLCNKIYYLWFIQ